MAQLMVDPGDPVVLDRFARLAAGVLDVPIVRIKLVDACRRTVVGSHPSGHPGSLTDRRTPPGPGSRRAVRNGSVARDVGMPLMTSDGRHVGTLTLTGRKQRPWSSTQIEFLRELSVRIVGMVDIGPVERMM